MQNYFSCKCWWSRTESTSDRKTFFLRRWQSKETLCCNCIPSHPLNVSNSSNMLRHWARGCISTNPPHRSCGKKSNAVLNPTYWGERKCGCFWRSRSSTQRQHRLETKKKKNKNKKITLLLWRSWQKCSFHNMLWRLVRQPGKEVYHQRLCNRLH